MLQTKHFLTPPETSSIIGTVIERLVLGFFALMNLIIVYEFFSTQLGGWRASEYAQAAAYVCAVIACCVVIARSKAKTVHILWAVMLVSLALRFLYVSLIPTRPCSDFEMLYLAAQKAAAGDFSWSRAAEGYFYTWAYQIPFALYQAVLFRLFHSLLALKLFNVLFMVGTNYLLYRIGKLYLSETAALCAAFIYAVFPGVLMYASVLTNQHISMFFLLLGVFLLLRADRRRTLCLAGCMLAASDLMRPEAVLILAALLCCGLLRCIQRPDVMTVRRTALSVLLVFACYWLAKSLTEWLLIWADIAPHGLGNQYPEWKFVLGLGNTDGYGGYSSKLASAFSALDGEAARRAFAAELIKDLFHRPPAEIFAFFLEKLRRFWTNAQDIMWSLFGLDQELLILPGLGLKLKDAWMLVWCERGSLLLVYLLALPAPVLLWREREKNSAAFFCAAVICVTICAYLLIEIQVRYRLAAIPFWLLTGGVTIEWLLRCADSASFRQRFRFPWRINRKRTLKSRGFPHN